MKIMNRIMLSSALLIFLSLTLLLTTVSIVLYLLGPEEIERLDENAFLVGKAIENFDMPTGDWDAINDRTSRYGYEILVLKNEELVYPPANERIHKISEKLKALSIGQNVMIGEKDGIITIAVEYGDFSIFAVQGMTNYSEENIVSEYLLPFFIACFIAMIIILALSQFFTRRMAWRILSPLNSLLDGAKRIKNGELSQPIVYSSKDEFAPVCTAFNHMQLHLLEELKRNAAYEQARIDLVAGISHDLRTPLTSIKGFIKGLRDGIANTPEKREQYLEIAYHKACDMEVLLERLFDFSKLEAGELSLSLKTEDLGEFVRLFVEEQKKELAQRNVSINAIVTSVAHLAAIDKVQMRRVLMNLVENAIQYADSQQLCLTICVQREYGYEHLTFADNGKGVADESIPHLFERFWRGDKARTPKNGAGNGLGLFIAKHIVEAHGGTIAAENCSGFKIDIALPLGKEVEI